MHTILYPVTDLQRAKPVYASLLGTQPSADAPFYVGFDADGLHLGLVPDGRAQGMPGPIPHWHVPDIRAAVNALVEAGATETQPAREVGGGRLVAVLQDPDGNPIGLIQG